MCDKARPEVSDEEVNLSDEEAKAEQREGQQSSRMLLKVHTKFFKPRFDREERQIRNAFEDAKERFNGFKDLI